MAEVRTKDLYDGRYRVYSDGRLMSLTSGNFMKGTKKKSADVIEVKLIPTQGGKQIYTALKKVVYEAFVKPLDKRVKLLHCNGDYTDCSAGNIYIEGEVNERVMEMNRPKYPSPEYAFGPPPFTRYVAKRTGEVYNVMTGDELKGYTNPKKVVDIHLLNDDPRVPQRVTAKPRFVYACFNRDFDMSNEKLFVYRPEDSDLDSNDVSNFALGNADDMLKSARSRDPSIAQRGGATRSTPIEVIEAGVVTSTYPSFRAASEGLGIAGPTLLALIRSGAPREGRVFRRHFPELLVTEAWYQIKERELPPWASDSIKGVGGMYVSDAGRVISRTGSLIVDQVDDHDGYRSFKYEGQTHFLHTLICYAFDGPQPSAKHTADHANRDIVDNRAVNLRWATKQEQGANMSHAVKVLATSSDTGAKMVHATRFAAARSVGVCHKTIRDACKSGAIVKGFTWRDLEEGEVEDIPVVAVVGHHEIVIPVEYNFITRLVWRAGEIEDDV